MVGRPAFLASTQPRKVNPVFLVIQAIVLSGPIVGAYQLVWKDVEGRSRNDTFV
jgi:hypothetical protein